MLDQAILTFQTLVEAMRSGSWTSVAPKFFPFVLLIELPLYVLVMAGILKYALRAQRLDLQRERYPRVSCIVTCYSEGADVRKTVRSLAHQYYRGAIEIIVVVDGARQNADTLAAARACHSEVKGLSNRTLVVLPKWQRGGRVSSLNASLQIATGEVVMALDGDTSFDNNMVSRVTLHFDNPAVVGVAGCLRVRNSKNSFVARMQALEYMLSIGAGRTGLSEFNLVNNVSGAFGVFRTPFLRHIGGWDSGTAEDLDLTLRIKQYFGRHPDLRIAFEPHAIGHTDAPESWRGFFRQRLRWEGDLYYLFVRKFKHNLRPTLLGWRNFFFNLIGGLYLQLVTPFLIVVYSVVLFWLLPPGFVLGVLAFIYVAYLCALTLYFFAYILAISERPKRDLRLLPLLPPFLLFVFVARLHTALAIAQEMLFKSHLESAMAPWWVLRKTKF
jgi:poly-beta-1,6-N-acetyl-D-glucosamine synthase